LLRELGGYTFQVITYIKWISSVDESGIHNNLTFRKLITFLYFITSKRDIGPMTSLIKKKELTTLLLGAHFYPSEKNMFSCFWLVNIFSYMESFSLQPLLLRILQRCGLDITLILA